jgi:hypothetical protein
MERETGLEPATSSLGSWHSTTELLPHACVFSYLPESKDLKSLTCQSMLSIHYPMAGLENGQHGFKCRFAREARRRS